MHVRCWFNSQLYKQYFTALVLTFHITGGRLFFFSISHEFYLFFKIYTTLYYYSLRDGSAIKSIGCSSREFRFSSHQPYGSSHLFLIPQIIDTSGCLALGTVRCYSGIYVFESALQTTLELQQLVWREGCGPLNKVTFWHSMASANGTLSSQVL